MEMPFQPVMPLWLKSVAHHGRSRWPSRLRGRADRESLNHGTLGKIAWVSTAGFSLKPAVLRMWAGPTASESLTFVRQRANRAGRKTRLPSVVSVYCNVPRSIIKNRFYSCHRVVKILSAPHNAPRAELQSKLLGARSAVLECSALYSQTPANGFSARRPAPIPSTGADAPVGTIIGTRRRYSAYCPCIRSRSRSSS